MAKVEVKLDKEGVKQLLTSSEVSDMITALGREKYGTLNADKGYELRTGMTHSSGKIGERAFAAIVAVGFRARRENAKNNTLLKLIS